MEDPMQRLITEKYIVKEVRSLIQNCDDVRMAVAYWGKDSITNLGLNATKGLWVVCDINSGACNPSEINSLIQKYDVRTLDKLHSKVYWTANGVIIGSSNASTGGFATLDEPQGNFEANIFTDDKAIIREVGLWLADIKKQSCVITKTMLENARKKWPKRPASQSLPTSLLAAFRANPEYFPNRNAHLVVYQGNESVEARYARQELARQQDAEKLASEIDYGRSWVYESAALPPGSYAISCRNGATRNRVDGIVRTSDPVSTISVTYKGDEIEHQQLATRVRRWTVDLGTAGVYYLSPGEREELETALPSIMKNSDRKGESYWYVSLPKVIEIIDAGKR
jgi:hypothetical protein